MGAGGNSLNALRDSVERLRAEGLVDRLPLGVQPGREQADHRDERERDDPQRDDDLDQGKTGWPEKRP